METDDGTRRRGRRLGARALLVGAVIAGLAAGGAVGAQLVPEPGGGGELTGVERAALDPALADAPWLYQPNGSPRIDEVEPRPSLVFPPGIDYAQALSALYHSALKDASIPPGTKLAEPLAADLVVVTPESPGDGLRLSLTAPWGYDEESGRIRPPSTSLPAEWSPARVEATLKAIESGATTALPSGMKVDVPGLAQCQVATGSAKERTPCA